MPSINIREIDLTGSETALYSDYAVLVPGVALAYTDGVESGEESKYLEGLLQSLADFDHKYDSSAPEDFQKDLGFLLAYNLVSRGMPVYYVPAYTFTDVEDASTYEYIEHETDPITGTEEAYTAETLYEDFKDKGKYDLRFITLGGLLKFDAVAASKAAIHCAGDRGDAVAILDVPEKGNLIESGGEIEVDLKNAVLIDEWVQENFSELANTEIERSGVSWSVDDEVNETYGRYGSIFTPACSAIVPVATVIQESGEEIKTIGSAENLVMKIPASFIYLTSFQKQLKSTPCWFATAGSSRGAPVYKEVNPTIKFGDIDINKIFQIRSADTQAANNHIATNVIANIRPYGNIIWGNRTMHPLQKPQGLIGATVQLQAVSFLNIRQLCCSLKKELFAASRKYTFDPNSDALWYNFKNTVTPLLDEMKTNQGVRGYSVIQIPTKKKALCVARISISPIEAVEDFDLTVLLSDSIAVNE